MIEKSGGRILCTEMKDDEDLLRTIDMNINIHVYVTNQLRRQQHGQGQRPVMTSRPVQVDDRPR